MLLRAIPFCLALAVLGTVAHQGQAEDLTVGEPPPCPDRQYVIDYMSLKYPGVTWVIYTGVDGSAIKAQLGRAAATEFIVFAKPGSENRFLVGLRDGCLEDSTVVPVRTLDKWLAGQEAGK